MSLAPIKAAVATSPIPIDVEQPLVYARKVRTVSLAQLVSRRTVDPLCEGHCIVVEPG